MKICKNWHKFDDNFQECPYCPRESKDKTSRSLHQSYNTTKIGSSGINDTATPYSSNDDKTKISGLDKKFIEPN